MSASSSIHVLPLSGKKEEWAVWSKKFLFKAYLSGFKDML
jgi:hypothetical protein